MIVGLSVYISITLIITTGTTNTVIQGSMASIALLITKGLFFDGADRLEKLALLFLEAGIEDDLVIEVLI